MLHVRILFDHQFVGDLHATGFRDAADVIAGQVDQHHVFGDFLRIGQQFFAERRILFRG
ncbi:hypothetical protein D3C81_2235650 [compost metagenome]